jgi:uncharacterized membrane protein YhiD involved in acid resistance
MSDAASMNPAKRGNGRPDKSASPGRLVAYYALLFLFIFQASLLLRELGANYNLEGFQKIKGLIDEAFNLSMSFDDVAYTFFALLLAFIFTLPLAWIYTVTRNDESFDPSLAQTIVVLAMVVTGVMIVISDETARAFALAGVVAAVRFRNTLQDTKDAVYVFIAVAIGMGCGTRVFHIAVWMSVIMSLTMYLLWKYQFGKSLRQASTLAGGGKGKKEVQKLYATTSAEALQNVERGLEQQVRLMQWADMHADQEKGKKKPNAALIVQCSDTYQAIAEVDKALEACGGKWQLANISSHAPGRNTLEYVGRLPKEVTPATLIDAIQQNGAACIVEVAFRSLKGLKSPLAMNKQPEKVDEGN